ncbi:MAG: type I-F CRISPR-associated helicase Cas3f, partial [Porticoccaceae bacterium]|nr:type I-F CRISPR-associated helicase Cas3f [Porticoccaceae bacterium]
NLYRHEWVSLRLFLAFVGKDTDQGWLRRMIKPSATDDASWTLPGRFWRDGIDANTPLPLANLPPVATAIAWLVVSHHRLPVVPAYDPNGKQKWFGAKKENLSISLIESPLGGITPAWNEIVQSADARDVEPYWAIAGETPPWALPMWRKRLATLAEKLLRLTENGKLDGCLDNLYVMHLSRLSLMLADHHYSSLHPDDKQRVKGDSGDTLFANTHNDGVLKQSLTEHLLGVARKSGSIVHSLPMIERGLPRLVGHKGLMRRSRDKRFRWQDKAADLATEMRESTTKNGAFIVNMASTGCGKTLANARILYALANPEEGIRASFALGLRTLTLQTGRSYRDDLKLSDDELAIRVGGSASRQLFEYYQRQAEESGSASSQALMEEDGDVRYEGGLEESSVLANAISDTRINSLLSAPVLVCTIDHLMPATEAQRAGRQIAPMLRLMSSDLVLDELDDFDINDLPALTRLVHWAGLLGSRVLISSATLPPSLVSGMYQAYIAGRRQFQRNRTFSAPAINPTVPCLWVDEFTARHSDCAGIEGFQAAHEDFIHRRVGKLSQSIQSEGAKRRGALIPLTLESRSRSDVAREFAGHVQAAILKAHHDHHEECPKSGKPVSFGLVRMANIEPLCTMAETLLAMDWPEGTRLHFCVYHSRFPLLLRSAIEHQLDTSLDRRDARAVYELPEIRSCIDRYPETNQIFVVLGSPVTEVGRDHDYGWAIVEPSSLRSLIQLAGRVQRHRQKPVETPNIYIFEKNLRHFYGRGKSGQPGAVFLKPGFEVNSSNSDDRFRLNSHDLNDLLREEDYRIISAHPRIQPAERDFNPKGNLADLEHARLMDCLLPVKRVKAPRGQKPQGHRPNAATNWQMPQASLTWAMAQHQPFRDNTMKEETLVFLPDDYEEQLEIKRIHTSGQGGKADVYTSEEKRVKRYELTYGRGVSPWGQFDLMALLNEQTEAQGKSLWDCGARMTTVQVPASIAGWRWNPILGFRIYRPKDER